MSSPILAYFRPLHFFWTDNARINPIFLLKHLTQKIYGDSISEDTAPSSDSSELIEIGTLNAIFFGHRHPILIIILPFDCKLNELSQLEKKFLKFSSKNDIWSKKRILQKKRYTLNVFGFSWKLVSRLLWLRWFQKSNRFDSQTPHSRFWISNHYFKTSILQEKRFSVRCFNKKNRIDLSVIRLKKWRGRK